MPKKLSQTISSSSSVLSIHDIEIIFLYFFINILLNLSQGSKVEDKSAQYSIHSLSLLLSLPYAARNYQAISILDMGLYLLTSIKNRQNLGL